MAQTSENSSYIFTSDQIRKVFRNEAYYSDFLPPEVPLEDAVYERCELSWDDLNAFLYNIENKGTTAKELEDWIPECENLAFGLCGEGDVTAEDLWMEEFDMREFTRWASTDTESLGYTVYLEGCPNASGMFYVIIVILRAVEISLQRSPEMSCTEFINSPALKKDIESMKAGDFSNICPVEWTDERELTYLYCFYCKAMNLERITPDSTLFCSETQNYNKFSDIEKHNIRRYADELSAKGYMEAIETKAICCYGGNDIYNCDWHTAHDCLVTLLENAEDFLLGLFIPPYSSIPEWATLLGDIYLEGVLQDETPDYEKAVLCYDSAAKDRFSDGSAIYKLAMLSRQFPEGSFIDHYFVRRESADMYSKEKKKCIYHKTNILAEAAYAMAGLCEDTNDAMNYYRIAEMALNDRITDSCTDYDCCLKDKIIKEGKKLDGNFTEIKPLPAVYDKTALINILYYAMFEGEDLRTVLFTVEKTDDTIILTGRRIKEWGSYSRYPSDQEWIDPPRFFVADPGINCYSLTDSIKCHFKCVSYSSIPENGYSFRANSLNVFSVDQYNGLYTFYRDDEVVAYIAAMDAEVEI